MDLQRGIVLGIGLPRKNSVCTTRTRGCRPNAHIFIRRIWGSKRNTIAARTAAPPRHERFGFGRRTGGNLLVQCHHRLLGSILFARPHLYSVSRNTSESDDSSSTRPSAYRRRCQRLRYELLEIAYKEQTHWDPYMEKDGTMKSSTGIITARYALRDPASCISAWPVAIAD